MKKISLMALAIAAAFGTTAQTNVVKDAERAMKSGEPASKVIEIVTPALTNPETAKLAKAWYIPGKAAFNQYDKMLGFKQLGQLKDGDNATMAKLLLDGYKYFKETLPYDQLPDAKGKVKPKYTKDIVNVFAGHFGDYSNMGIEMYNDKKYDEAYALWGVFCELPNIPAVAKNLNDNKTMPADTVFGEIAFNQAIAAWQNEKLADALKAFDYARKHSYKKKALYDYAISVASNLNDTLAIVDFAKEALPLYGNEDPMYMGQVVNYYLQKQDYDKAFEIINKAISGEPSNAQYYVIRGVLYENTKKMPEAKADYIKAKNLDPNNASAVYNYGRMLCEEAYALNDAAPTDQNEYNKYYNEKIRPLFLQAVDILENAYDLDQENLDILRYLENVYYNLNDEAKLEDVRNRMKN